MQNSIMLLFGVKYLTQIDMKSKEPKFTKAPEEKTEADLNNKL